MVSSLGYSPEDLPFPANDLPRSYAFPNAALFIGIKTPDKMFTYLRWWLAYHSALIFRLLPHDSQATPLSGDHWHAFLSAQSTMSTIRIGGKTKNWGRHRYARPITAPGRSLCPTGHWQLFWPGRPGQVIRNRMYMYGMVICNYK